MSYKKDYGLPNAIEGMTVADGARYIQNRFKGRNSIIDLGTLKEFMSRLRDVQEMQKQKLEAKRQKVEGQNQMYTGGYDGEEPVKPALSIYEQTMANRANPNTQIDFTSQLSNQITQGANQTLTSNNNQPSWLDKASSYMSSDKGQSVLGGIGLGISALAPMIANRRAAKSMTRPTTVNPMLMDVNQVQPNFVNRQQLMRGLSEQASTQRYNMAQTGGNWGQYSQGVAGLNASMLGTAGNLMLQSDLADSADKFRVQQGRIGLGQFNIGQTQRAEELNAQNLAAYQGTQAAYKQATGANIGNIGQSLFNYITAQKVAKSAGNTYGYEAINPNRQQR